LIKTQQGSFTNTSIRNQLRIPISSVKRYHAALLASGLIKKIESRNSKAHYYEIISREEYIALQNSIATALDEALQKVKVLSKVEGQLSGSTSAHNQNEPKKRKLISNIQQQLTTV
jgi:predicted transcriptional regulator